MSDRKDYEVGYGKPPKEHRFKPGVSGNPRGKPKGACDLKTELKSVLDEKIELTIDGKRKRIPRLRLVIRALAAKAVTGHVAAADKLLSLVIQSQGFEDTRPNRRELSGTDMRILAHIFADDGLAGPPILTDYISGDLRAGSDACLDGEEDPNAN